MIKIFSFRPIVLIALLLIAGCSNVEKSKSSISDNKDSESVKNELDTAFKKNVGECNAKKRN